MVTTGGIAGRINKVTDEFVAHLRAAQAAHERDMSVIALTGRGGGELGRAWYEDGKELVKEHTFTDFIDVADWLVRQYLAFAQLFA